MTLNDVLKQAGVKDNNAWADGILMHPERIPEPHQIRNLNYLLVNMYWGLFDEPGTMKTLPVQAWAMYLAAHGNKVLCIMPPVLTDQFIEALHFTFIGSERFHVHKMEQDPYPMRLTKKRVQEVKASLARGDSVSHLPEELVNRIDKLRLAMPVYFNKAEIDHVRQTKGKVKNEAMAKEMGCSQNAIAKLRNTTFREDLFAEWNANDSWPDIMVMSYGMFYRVHDELREAYRVLVADEAHALCHSGSGTWKRVRKFLNNHGGNTAFCPMTGTPNPNLLTDSYGLIKLLNPKAYGSFRDFDATHCDYVSVEDRAGRTFRIRQGYRNLDLLRINLFARASRVTKEQVFTLEKPSIFETEIQLSDEHRAAYRKLVREGVIELPDRIISGVEAQSMRQKAARMVVDPDQFTAKPIKENAVLQELEELLDEIGAAHQEKVVLFGIYNKSIQKIAEHFAHLNPAVVYGKSDSKKNVKKFLNDDTCRLMVAHYKSGGVGLNLQSLARYVICFEPTSVPGDFLQAIERVYRKGQKRHVTIYIFRVKGTVWIRKVESMRGKMALTSNVQMDRSELLSELLGED